MRDIKYIVIHCTATSHNTKVTSIQRYWRDLLGWKSPGYHHIVDAKGLIHDLQPIEKTTNGVAGFNAHSIHISYIGGAKTDDRTPQQKAALIYLVKKYKQMFPNAIVQGHRDFLKKGKPGWKDCPQFDAKKEYLITT